jgi:hypothetical protein
VSLLLEAGHAEAYHYPLGRLFDEVNMVIERRNGIIATETQLRREAVGALFSRKLSGSYRRLLKKLETTTEPVKAVFRGR